MKRELSNKHDGAPVYGARFESIGAWLAFADAASDQVEWHSSRHIPASDRWDYGVGYDGAKSLIAQGWTDGARDVLEAAGGLTVIQDQADRVAVAHAPTGFMALPQAALNGDPDCWLMAEIQEQPQQPVITLMIGNGALYSMDAPEFTKRGAALLSVVNVLEAAGVRVDLYAYALNEVEDVACIFQAYKVKDADQPLNVEALAAVFSHPATHRRLAFRVIEILSEETDIAPNSYGRTTTPSRELAEELIGRSAFVVPAFGKIEPYETVAGLTRRYLDALAKQGALNQEQVNDLKAAL